MLSRIKILFFLNKISKYFIQAFQVKGFRKEKKVITKLYSIKKSKKMSLKLKRMDPRPYRRLQDKKETWRNKKGRM